MNQRDLELLSSYLDGQLNPSDTTRLEARLKTDSQLAKVLRDLRSTRSLLRRLPQRRAPRNFTLTRKMVGQNPPLPRTYPLFRFASALAMLLFFFSFGLNAVGRYTAQPPAFGMGGGGADSSQESTELFSQTAPAAEAPAATEAPAEEPSVAMAPAPTQTTSAEDQARLAEETPIAKEGETGNAAGVPDQPPVQIEAQRLAPLVSSGWQIGLLAAALVSALLMWLSRRRATDRWR